MTSGRSMFVLLQLLLAATTILAVAVSVSVSEPLSATADCPLVCPALFAPLCASDDDEHYLQFDNLCELKVKNCARARSVFKPFIARDMYWCTSEFVDNLAQKVGGINLEKPECMKPCPMIWAPVCVSNGTLRGTLSNACLLENFNCALDSKLSTALFKVLRMAEC